NELDHVFLKGILYDRVAGGDGPGSHNPDGHFQPGEGEGNGNDDNMVDAKFENILQEAKNECDSRSQKYGSGSYANELLAKLLKSRVDYRTLLQRFAASTRDVQKERRWRKRHRRYPTQTPGNIVKRQPNIVVIADSSGSMTDQETINNLNSQIAALHAVCQNVTVIVGDTQERARFDLSKQRFSHGTVKYIGGGGTDLQFGFDAAKE